MQDLHSARLVDVLFQLTLQGRFLHFKLSYFSLNYCLLLVQLDFITRSVARQICAIPVAYCTNVIEKGLFPPPAQHAKRYGVTWPITLLAVHIFLDLASALVASGDRQAATRNAACAAIAAATWATCFVSQPTKRAKSSLQRTECFIDCSRRKRGPP
jgi:hypothetical protein